MRTILLRTGWLVAVLSTAITAYAHHSASAAFTESSIAVEGVVTEFNFTNPHMNILFDVTDEDGETTQWMASASAANLLRRQGWTRDTIQAGQYLRMTGRETRDGSPMLWIQDDSVITELNSSDGSFVRNVQGESDYQDPVASVPLSLTFGDGRPNLTGIWGRGRAGGMGMGMGGNAPPFNELGAAMQAEFDPISDPAVGCKDPGLVRQAGFTPHPVEMTQNDDHVILEYEEYGGRRVIYLDGRGPQSAEHTNLGHSVGSYDGDMLVIETTRLLGNYTSPSGNPLSDQTTTVETYRRMDDPDTGAVLAMEMVIADPGHLSTPWMLGWQKTYTPGYKFIEVECIVPFTYREAE